MPDTQSNDPNQRDHQGSKHEGYPVEGSKHEGFPKDGSSSQTQGE